MRAIISLPSNTVERAETFARFAEFKGIRHGQLCGLVFAKMQTDSRLRYIFHDQPCGRP